LTARIFAPRHAAAATGERDFQSRPPLTPASFCGKTGCAGVAALATLRGPAPAPPAYSREQDVGRIIHDTQMIEQEMITLTKTLDDRIAETKAKITQYENQVKRLTQRQTEAERKARTRRLIEWGALLESFLAEPETLSNEQVKEILINWRASHNTR